jgi:hypothetical protein
MFELLVAILPLYPELKRRVGMTGYVAGSCVTTEVEENAMVSEASLVAAASNRSRCDGMLTELVVMGPR